jgi:hypothetical protein
MEGMIGGKWTTDAIVSRRTIGSPCDPKNAPPAVTTRRAAVV